VESSDQPVRIADVARELGLSPSRIRQLADAGVILSTRTSGGHRLFDLAAVRAAVARRSLMELPSPMADTGDPTWKHELTLLGLAEHEVWRRIIDDLGLNLDSEGGRIMAYAFMEMLNNAIDHSGSETATITLWISPDVAIQPVWPGVCEPGLVAGGGRGDGYRRVPASRPDRSTRARGARCLV